MKVFHFYPSNLSHQDPQQISALQHRGRKLICGILCISSGQTDPMFLCTPQNSCWFGSFLHFSLLLWLKVLWADLVFLLCGWTALSGITSGHENRPGKPPNDNPGKSRAENAAYASSKGRPMGDIGAADVSAEVGLKQLLSGVGLVPCAESSTSSAAALLQRLQGFPFPLPKKRGVLHQNIRTWRDFTTQTTWLHKAPVVGSVDRMCS